MKTKKNKSREVLIVGYKMSADRPKRLTTLIFGLKEDIGINYCGLALAGFEEEETQHKLLSLLKPLRVEKSPLFQETEYDPEIIWIKPVLVCEAAYKSKTPAGVIKDAEFLWLREDKNISGHLSKTDSR